MSKIGQTCSFLPIVDDESRKLSQAQIKRIDYVENVTFEAQFEDQKKEFLSNKISGEEKLLFHGTHPANISSILSRNFDAGEKPLIWKKMALYGEGTSTNFILI